MRIKKIRSRNKYFSRLINITEEDSKIKTKLIKILDLNPIDRKIFLQELIYEQKIKQAPKENINVLNNLIDDEIAEKAHILLNASRFMTSSLF